jgi:hypothetical protein
MIGCSDNVYIVNISSSFYILRACLVRRGLRGKLVHLPLHSRSIRTSPKGMYMSVFGCVYVMNVKNMKMYHVLIELSCSYEHFKSDVFVSNLMMIDNFSLTPLHLIFDSKFSLPTSTTSLNCSQIQHI